MKLKEFLKPNWKKAVIFSVAFLILSQLKLFCYPTTVTMPGFPAFEPTEITQCFNLEGLYSYGPYVDLILAYAEFMIISYLVSCFIIWLYNRYFKKVN